MRIAARAALFSAARPGSLNSSRRSLMTSPAHGRAVAVLPCGRARNDGSAQLARDPSVSCSTCMAAASGVACDKVRLPIWMRSLILGDQPAGPGLLFIVGQRAVYGKIRVRGRARFRIRVGVRLLLGEQLIK